MMGSIQDDNVLVDPSHSKIKILLKNCYITSMGKKKNIEAISKNAMKSQRASFRIEGIYISKKKQSKFVVRLFRNFNKNLLFQRLTMYLHLYSLIISTERRTL